MVDRLARYSKKEAGHNFYDIILPYHQAIAADPTVISSSYKEPDFLTSKHIVNIFVNSDSFGRGNKTQVGVIQMQLTTPNML